MPITGAVGVRGCGLIVALGDDAETHPNELVTVKEYVPDSKPAIIVLVPFPVVVMPPGVRVIVQSPTAGNPLSCMLPNETKQVG